VLSPSAGRVALFGDDVTGWPVHRRARAGVGRTFQRLELFASLSVLDNLVVAAESHLATCKLTSSRAWSPPKRTDTPRTSRARSEPFVTAVSTPQAGSPRATLMVSQANPGGPSRTKSLPWTRTEIVQLPMCLKSNVPE